MRGHGQDRDRAVRPIGPAPAGPAPASQARHGGSCRAGRIGGFPPMPTPPSPEERAARVLSLVNLWRIYITINRIIGSNTIPSHENAGAAGTCGRVAASPPKAPPIRPSLIDRPSPIRHADQPIDFGGLIASRVCATIWRAERRAIRPLPSLFCHLHNHRGRAEKWRKDHESPTAFMLSR